MNAHGGQRRSVSRPLSCKTCSIPQVQGPAASPTTPSWKEIPVPEEGAAEAGLSEEEGATESDSEEDAFKLASDRQPVVDVEEGQGEAADEFALPSDVVVDKDTILPGHEEHRDRGLQVDPREHPEFLHQDVLPPEGADEVGSRPSTNSASQPESEPPLSPPSPKAWQQPCLSQIGPMELSHQDATTLSPAHNRDECSTDSVVAQQGLLPEDGPGGAPAAHSVVEIPIGQELPSIGRSPEILWTPRRRTVSRSPTFSEDGVSAEERTETLSASSLSDETAEAGAEQSAGKPAPSSNTGARTDLQQESTCSEGAEQTLQRPGGPSSEQYRPTTWSPEEVLPPAREHSSTGAGTMSGDGGTMSGDGGEPHPYRPTSTTTPVNIFSAGDNVASGQATPGGPRLSTPGPIVPDMTLGLLICGAVFIVGFAAFVL